MQVSEFFEPIGMFHRNFPWAPCLKRFPSKHTDIGSNPRYRTRYAQVGCSARARARPRAREPPGSEYRMFEYHSCPARILVLFKFIIRCRTTTY